MTPMIRSHWHRGDDAECARDGCGQPRSRHLEAVGEWMAPRHWYRPRLRSPWTCARCDRRPGHSTHRGSREHRRLWRS